MEKLQYSTQFHRNNKWSGRSLAAHLALLMYAADTIGISPGDHFNAMEVLRDLGRDVSQDQSRWDRELVIEQSYLDDISKWTDEILQHGRTWRHINATPTEWDLRMVTDASLWGWSAAAIDRQGRIFHTSQPWKNPYLDAMHLSTRAEPRAIHEATRWAMSLPSREPIRRIESWTDHQSFTYTNRQGWSRSFLVNEVIRKLRRDNPFTTFAFNFVAGSENPVDLPSRGGDWSDALLVRARAFLLGGRVSDSPSGDRSALA
jgi:hypothetical protein